MTTKYLGSTPDGERFSVEPPLSGNVFDDMAAFDRKYGFNDVDMTPKFLAFRIMFLIEELFEGIQAIEANKPEGFVDAMIDLIVVAAGTLSIGRVDSQQAWNEVRRSNMAKVRRDNPTRSGSGGADLCKPDGWVAPNHTDNVGQFANISNREFSRHFPHSMTVLFECLHMQRQKYDDYNSGLVDVERADYWIHGIQDLEYEMHKKLTRFRSVLSRMRAGHIPNFESLTDSLKDNINYNSYSVAWLRGSEPGQDPQMSLFGE